MTKEFLYLLGKSIKFLKPQRALIFGSFVHKGLNAKDIDLLVISDFFNQHFWQERVKFIDLPPGPIYDIRLFTSIEFESLYPIKTLFRQNLENHNINLEVFYGDI
jgi:predicted nucleotidyltransferase